MFKRRLLNIMSIIGVLPKGTPNQFFWILRSSRRMTFEGFSDVFVIPAGAGIQFFGA